MEDAHILKADVAPDVAVFGVFDGHGGNNFNKLKEKICKEKIF